MISLKINGKKIETAPGTTIRQAALQANVLIPALCFMDNYPHHTSCMICVVKDKSADKLIPSCTATVESGMDIETDSREVLDARRTTLELLLSEHLGDCEAPCRRGCPAQMNIPYMLRHIREGNFNQAIQTVFEHIPLPSLISRICPAPCEKICRRKDYDQPVSIKALVRTAARQNSENLHIPRQATNGGKKVAVCGAGPAGLSAAFYLALCGHSVIVFEKAAGACRAFGREFKSEPDLIQAIDKDIKRIKTLGVRFHFNTELGNHITLSSLEKEYAAVIIAVGRQASEFWQALGFKYSDKGVIADSHTYTTSKKKIFACGSALSPIKLAATAVNRGRACALSADGFLRTKNACVQPRQFDSHIGKLDNPEIKQYLNLSSKLSATGSAGNKHYIFTPLQGKKQAGRCLHCDCRKAASCVLRTYSTQYNVKASRYKPAERKRVRIIKNHPRILFEPGKCIKCGRCVRITTAKKESLGLTFIGRGFDIEVGVPFNKALSKALTHTAQACVKFCPTGALAFYKPGAES